MLQLCRYYDVTYYESCGEKILNLCKSDKQLLTIYHAKIRFYNHSSSNLILIYKKSLQKKIPPKKKNFYNKAHLNLQKKKKNPSKKKKILQQNEHETQLISWPIHTLIGLQPFQSVSLKSLFLLFSRARIRIPC